MNLSGRRRTLSSSSSPATKTTTKTKTTAAPPLLVLALWMTSAESWSGGFVVSRMAARSRYHDAAATTTTPPVIISSFSSRRRRGRDNGGGGIHLLKASTSSASASDVTSPSEDDDQEDRDDDDLTVAEILEGIHGAIDDDDEEEDDALAAEDEDEAAFLERCRRLSRERNLPLEKVLNARDLSSASNSTVVPGRVYRTGRLSDATDRDMELLFDRLGIKTIIDTRSPTELKDDPTLMRDEVFHDFTDMVWIEQGRNRDGFVKELPSGVPPVKPRRKKKRFRRFFSRRRDGEEEEHHDDLDDDHHEKDRTLQQIVEIPHDDDHEDDEEDEEDDDHHNNANAVVSAADISRYYRDEYGGERRERHFVSLMNEFKYVKGTVGRVRKRDITKAILKSPGAIVSRRVRSSCKKPFLDSINSGGLPMLNELLLRFGSPGIKYCLDIIADPARHPVAFHCTAGKDRTGIIAVILLALCDVDVDSVVEDYTLSANVYAEMDDHKAMVGALSQRSLNPKVFLGAPAHVMYDTIRIIEAQYGGVEGYCNWIGFDESKQQQLRNALMRH